VETGREVCFWDLIPQRVCGWEEGMPVGDSVGEETWRFSGCPLVTLEAGTRGVSFIDQATHEFVRHGGLGDCIVSCRHD